MMPGRIENYI